MGSRVGDRLERGVRLPAAELEVNYGSTFHDRRRSTRNGEENVYGVEVQTFKADGMVVSTPTGSTAYAMSAGGSIVDPLIHDGYLVVPIAPYLLSSRPQLISTKRKLEIDIASEYAFIVVDGREPVRVDNRYHRVEIQVDPNPAKFVFVNRNFFKKVGDKLMRM